ncbi:MAG TPA: LuxR C-terminal-related transcriptional regulator [Lapillicoccus sp.]|nr:LuxR C-terminal-related transcriptional regulator [Lapillicoccus sp.]
MTRAVTGRDAEVVTESALSALQILAEGRGHLLLVGPTGFGKSHTLRHLERSSRTLGLRTHRYPLPAGAEPPDVVLVDDAHLLPARELAVLGNGLGSAARIVAAVEPAPAEGSFGEVLDRLAAAGTVVPLEAWTVDEVATLIDHGTDASGDPTAVAEAVVAATGGLPWLVTDLLAEGEAVNDSHSAGQPSRAERQVLRVLSRLPRLVNEMVMALCVGYAIDREPLPASLASLRGPAVRDLLDRVYDAGILSRDGQVPPLVRRAVLRHAPRHRLSPYLVSAVDDLVTAGVDLGPLAEDLVGAGLRDPRLVAALVERGDARSAEDPATSVRLYAAALTAGGDPAALAVSRAQALALLGDLDGAHAALADVTALHQTPDAAGIRVAASVAVLDGQLADAAALCRWAAGHGDLLSRDADAAAVAAYVLYGVGDADTAAGLIDSADLTTPGLTSSPVRALAGAVRRSLDRDPAAAMSSPVAPAHRASAGRRELLPDRPNAFAALVAMHAGDLAMAESALGRETETDDDRLLGSRHTALVAWTRMQAGQYRDAQDALDVVDARSPREQPWVWAMRVGLARRQDDVRALARLWVDARGALVGHPVDLYSLLPLGELGLAAARMHEPELAAPVWNRAMALLDRLGNPPLWSPAFHWYGVQAAILTNRPQALTPHAAALLGAARTSPYAAVLARAGRAWVAVLGGDVDPASVESAARALGAVGQRWEGARLAGHAAARAADRRDAAVLMECARDLLAATSNGAARHTPPSPAESKAGVVALSPREREVVELILSGMTYRQVGESLYLSAKTVEHHMARIKRRSGATTRAELLERLSLTVS